MTTIEALWEIQAEQQRELGLDPRHQDAVSRRRLSADLATQLAEEGVQLSRIFGVHKRHMLSQKPVSKANIAEQCADTVKSVIALAQLYDISAEELTNAFKAKTRVVSAKAAQEREVLTHETRLAVFDLDDCICDLTPWTDHLRRLQGGAPPNAKTLAMMEAYKDEFYSSGKFGTEFGPVPGAPEGVRLIKRMGYKVVILTARPQWQHKRLYGDTIDWLERHHVPVDFILFNKDKVEAIHTHLAPAWPTLFVEDHPRNVSALSAAGVNVLLFDRIHNRRYAPPEGVNRVFGWTEIVEAFREHLR